MTSKARKDARRAALALVHGLLDEAEAMAMRSPAVRTRRALLSKINARRARLGPRP
jgi:hypothetical protein